MASISTLIANTLAEPIMTRMKSSSVLPLASKRFQYSIEFLMGIRNEPECHKFVEISNPLILKTWRNTGETLYKNARGILNKITPEKFDVLVGKFKALPIDTEEQLRGVISLIFEKAIDEPGFCKWYAQLCFEMQEKKLATEDGTKEISFRIVLLNNCQRTFEKAVKDEEDTNEMRAQMDDCEDPEKKKELELQLEEQVRNVRKRSVGNCKFIGELFKLEMLTPSIMLRCMNSLINSSDEESLECLCKLLTTIGKEFEVKINKMRKELADKSNSELEAVFRRLRSIAGAKKSKVSSRIRFMILDLIDLRKNQWKPRRDTNNPKTIDQINMEFEKKEQVSKMANYTMKKSYDEGNSGAGRNRGGELRKNGNDNMNREDRRQQVTQNRKSYKINTGKFESLRNNDTTLGPSLGPPAFNSWRSGCAGNGAPRSGGVHLQPLSHTMARTSVGGSTNSWDKLTPFPFVQRPQSEKFRQSAPITSSLKNNSANSGENLPRSTVLRNPSQNAPAPVVLDEDSVKRSCQNILNEYDMNRDSKEAALSFNERFTGNENCSSGIKELINIVLDSPRLLKSCGELFDILIRNNHINMLVIINALSTFMELESELIVDYPNLWSYITDILSIPLRDQQKFNSFVSSFLKKFPDKSDCKWLVALSEKLDGFGIDKAGIYCYLKSNLRSDQDEYHSICEWINKKAIGSHSNVTVVKSLCEAVCEILLEDFSRVDQQLDSLFEMKFSALMKRYIDNHENLELLCLNTVLDVTKSGKYPSGFLLYIINILYNTKIISKDALWNWRETNVTKEPMAMVSLKTFFETVFWELREKEAPLRTK